MPDDAPSGLRVTADLVVPESELSWRFSRSSGPGGQGVNTADSRVELSWDVAASIALTDGQRARILERLGGRMSGGVLTVAASERRAQLRNRAAARSRLAALVADALASPAPRRATRPTAGSARRRIDAKKRRAGVKRMRRPPQD